jgi:uncharacterized protein
VTEALPATIEVDPQTQRWGLGDVLLGIFVSLLGSQLAVLGILLATDRSVDEFDTVPLSLVALAQCGLWFGLLGVPWLATKTKGRGLVADLGLRARWSDLWQGGVAGALLQLAILPLLYAPLLHLLDKSTKDLEGPARELTDRADGALAVILLVLIVGIGAPVIEEIFYRGLMQRSFLKRGLPPWLAIAATSLIFGLSHFELLQLPALILAGAVFGWLAQRTGRLGPAITAHVAFNMVTVVALLAG